MSQQVTTRRRGPGTFAGSWLVVGAIVTAVLPSATAALGADKPARPNIVLIMADDMGYSDIGCYGGEIRTPNIDALARGGLRFTQFYNTSRCCPTRATLLTGLWSHQAGMGGMVKAGKNAPPAYQGYLNNQCVTIAEALRPFGYRALMSGKWHVGEERGHWPLDRGFERYFGLISGACNYWKLDKGRKMALENEPFVPSSDDFYMTDAFTDYAVKMVDEYALKDDPFFLYVAYTAPHWPLHARPDDIERYRGKYLDGWAKLREKRHARMIAEGIVSKDWPLSPLDAKDWDSLSDKQKQDFDLKMAVYAAQIDRMDQGVGRIVDKLKEVGELDNTLILFLADNGGCHEQVNRSETADAPPGPRESFLSYGRNWANASNTPFRRYKHWVHEGGISSPLIAHWPKGLKRPEADGDRPAGLTDQVAHLVDLMPTFLELAEAGYPIRRGETPIVPLEGKSLVPVLQGETLGPRQLYWEHFRNRAMRDGDWKLVAVAGGDWELYDLATDRTELNNLAKEKPAKLAELKAKYEAWAKRVGVREANK